MNDAVRLDRDGGLAVITLNRPDAMNALNLDMAEGLLEAAIVCDEDAGVRAVMVTGAGTVFCAGGDIAAMVENADGEGNAGAFLKKLAAELHAGIATLARMEKPVIAAVNGTAAGAGFSLALACDLVLAVEDARLTMAYTRIGLAPDGSSTYFLPRLIGMKRALDMMLTNRVVTGLEAHAMGLVSETFPAASFGADARAYAAKLAEGPTKAYAQAKLLVTLGAAETLETQMELERRAIAGCANTADFREGVKAFFEKRSAHYEGR
jgi:2-(1,2-epoxy-1,2-dihydrophenyl)acetyl-CoA isomerase